MAAPNGLRPSLLLIRASTTCRCAARRSWSRFTSQDDGHRQVSLNKDTIFKVESGSSRSHIGFTASEQVSRSPMEESDRCLYVGAPRRCPIARNKCRKEPAEWSASVDLFKLSGNGDKGRLCTRYKTGNGCRSSSRIDGSKLGDAGRNGQRRRRRNQVKGEVCGRNRKERERRDHKEVGRTCYRIEPHTRLQRAGIVVACQLGQRAPCSGVNRERCIVVAAEGIRFQPHVLGWREREPHSLCPAHAEWIVGGSSCIGHVLAYSERHGRYDSWTIEVVIRRRWRNHADMSNGHAGIAG